MSPKGPLLALGFSAMGEKDPVDGEYRNRNTIRIYDYTTGDLVGERLIATTAARSWKLRFADDGRQLAVGSEDGVEYFDLEAVHT
jgi:WD40 repeat protein